VPRIREILKSSQEKFREDKSKDSSPIIELKNKMKRLPPPPVGKTFGHGIIKTKIVEQVETQI